MTSTALSSLVLCFLLANTINAWGHSGSIVSGPHLHQGTAIFPESLLFPTFASFQTTSDSSSSSLYVPIHGVRLQRHPKTANTHLQRLFLFTFRLFWRPRSPADELSLKYRFSYFFASVLSKDTMPNLVVDGIYPVHNNSSFVGKNGHFETSLTLPAHTYPPGSILNVTHYDPIANQTFSGRVHVYSPSGYSIITDIDDTVKDTRCIAPSQFFRMVYQRKYNPVPGMPALFQHLRRTLAPPHAPNDVAFHYVSGTPYQLFPILDEFIQRSGLPLGPIQLGKFRFRDPQTIVNVMRFEKIKIWETERVVHAYPNRSLLLFGDTGQRDAFAYAQLMRKDPQGHRYQCAFIKLLQGVNPEKERRLNSVAKMEKAFNGVARRRWYLFRDPEELLTVDIKGGRCKPQGVDDEDVGGHQPLRPFHLPPDEDAPLPPTEDPETYA